MGSIISAVLIILRVFSFVVIIDVLLSFFLPPYNPIKTFLDKVVDPFLSPIRRLIPAVGGFDFSPVVLLLLLQLLEYLLVQVVR